MDGFATLGQTRKRCRLSHPFSFHGYENFDHPFGLSVLIDSGVTSRRVRRQTRGFTHLNKRFLRFGRSEPSPLESGEQIQRVERQGEPYLRIGRQGDPYLRFGRQGDPYLRFGRSGEPYLRFGRQGEPYLRFGRSGEPYLRFGRQGDPYLRFGRQGEPYLRIGRSGEPYLRFGRQGEPYLRFGRSDDDVDAPADVKLEGEGEEDQRAARSERSVGSQQTSDLAAESGGPNDAPAAARSRRDLRPQHLSADRQKREGFLRFGRDKTDDQSETKDGQGASALERPGIEGPSATRDVSQGGSDKELSRQGRLFPRWGKRYLRFGRREGYLRFGKRELDS